MYIDSDRQETSIPFAEPQPARNWAMTWGSQIFRSYPWLRNTACISVGKKPATTVYSTTLYNNNNHAEIRNKNKDR